MLKALAHLVDVWYLEREWLDKEGQPRAISSTGPKGFVGLCRAAGIRAQDQRTLLSVGLALSALERDRHRRLLPTARTIILREPSAMALERTTACISNLLSTIQHNLSPRTTDAQRRLDREVRGPAIPKHRLPAFNRFLHGLIDPHVHRVSEWLSDNAAEASDRDVVHVGMHVFAFTEDPRRVMPVKKTSAGRRSPRRRPHG